MTTKGRDLREINVVIETGKTLRLVTNDLSSPAEVIADLYQERWEIELFFRWIKQTLRIRKFLGTSENAVRIQITVALIKFLLMRLAHAAQKAVTSPLAFARLVRANLMHCKSIHDFGRDRICAPTDQSQLEMLLQ
jgi:IS4 transposase